VNLSQLGYSCTSNGSCSTPPTPTITKTPSITPSRTPSRTPSSAACVAQYSSCASPSGFQEDCCSGLVCCATGTQKAGLCDVEAECDLA
jgi:hypothetical protein